MLKNRITVLVLCFLFIWPITAAMADDAVPACRKLDEKAGGDALKYSLHADVNGPLFFSGIICAVKYGNKVFWATEMVSFDRSAKVYDFYTGEETDISKAYFWLDEKNDEMPILAFSSRENAEKYRAGKEGSVVLDYTGLIDRGLK